MQPLNKPTTTPEPGEEITLSWLLENPITRPRTICSLAGIIADFNDLDSAEVTDADTRDLWFLTNQIWRTLDRPEVEHAFATLRRRTDARKRRRETKLNTASASFPRARHGQSELSPGL
jgi:hypothetical protein